MDDEQEQPKKFSTGNGTNFFCTVCKDENEPELSSLRATKDHYKETGHAVAITSWFNSIYGTEDDYISETESVYDI